MAKSPTQITTGKVRLSYANIWTPKAMNEGQEPKYSVALLIPKTDKETLDKVKAAMKAAIDQGESILKDPKTGKMPTSVKKTLYDGDGEKPNGGEYGEECKGCYVLNTSSKQKPLIVDKNVEPILDQTEVYSGSYARVSVNFYAYNNSGSKGIGCGLGNIQKIADGEPLGGRTRPEDDFDAIEDDDLLS